MIAARAKKAMLDAASVLDDLRLTVLDHGSCACPDCIIYDHVVKYLRHRMLWMGSRHYGRSVLLKDRTTCVTCSCGTTSADWKLHVKHLLKTEEDK